jgi:serine/threonine protein kinase/tetratricopeptide (TPR) repeat protein
MSKVLAMTTILNNPDFEQRLDTLVDQFEEQLSESADADVRPFLPACRTEDDFRIAAELLCVDLQYRWPSNRRWNFHDYERAFPAYVNEPLVRRELAWEEYRMRYASGESVEACEFAARCQVPWESWPGSRRVNEQVVEEREWSIGELSLDWIEPFDPFPTPGQEIAGFTIEEELGRGSFAMVYRARQHDLAGRSVVLKISAHATVEPEHLARLQHANIVPIYSLHQHGPLQVICMPYFGRRTLAAAISDQEVDASLDSVTAIVQLIRQLAAGLQHAHRHAIVHRDLKPANVLIADDGTPMLLDFNLSDRVTTDSMAYLLVGGTLPYLAPEHLRALLTGERVMPASDIYSLGVLFYQLLTRRLPFPMRDGQFADRIEQMVADRAEPFPAASSLNARVSPSLEAIIDRLLAVSSDERYRSMDEVVEDLDRYTGHLPLKFAKNRSMAEQVRNFAKRHPRISSATTVGSLAASLLLAAVLSLMGAQQDLAASRAQATLRQASDLLPSLRVTLSQPLPDDTTLAASVEEARRFVDQFVIGPNVGDSLPGFKYLSDDQQQTLKGNLHQLFHLVALHDEAMARQVHDESERNDWLMRAQQYNHRAAILLAMEDEALQAESGNVIERQADRIGRLLEGHIDPVGHAVEAAPLTTDYAPDRWLAVVEQLRGGRFAEAIVPLLDLAEQSPQDASVWLLLGNAYAGTGQLARAEHCYTVCLSLWPDSLVARCYRGICRLQQRQFEAALSDFDACLARDDGFLPARINRSSALVAMQRLEEAETELTLTLRQGATQTRLYLWRAKLRRAQGDLAGAAADEARAMELVPSDENSWIERGLAHLTHNTDLAIADFQAALQLNPRSRGALRNLAFVRGEQRSELLPALEILDRLIEMHHHPDDIMSRAVYHARLNQRDAALADVESSLKQGRTAKRLLQAACVYSLLGKDETTRVTAIGLLEEALAIDPRWTQVAVRDVDLRAIRETDAFQEIVQTARERLHRQATIPLFQVIDLRAPVQEDLPY